MKENTELKDLMMSKSNYELVEIYKTGYNYEIETIAIVDSIIESRGGIDIVYENSQIEIKKMPIKEHLFDQILNSLKNGKPIEGIRNQISYDVLTEEDVDAIFLEAKEEFNKFSEDIKVTSESTERGILGGFIGGTIGGGLLGMLLMSTERFTSLIGLVLIAISYIFVWLFSRKSIDNAATITITILSTIYAIILGFLIS